MTHRLRTGLFAVGVMALSAVFVARPWLYLAASSALFGVGYLIGKQLNRTDPDEGEE